MSTETDTMTRPSAERRRRGRATLVLATTVVVVMSLLTTAHAATTVEEGPYREGLFYGDFDREVLFFAGGTAEQFCTGDEPVHEARYTTGDDGRLVIAVEPNVERPLYLYSSPLGAPEFLAEQCPLLEDGDPSTGVQEPFATGQGRMKLRLEIAPDGTVDIVNTSWGSVADEEGTTWRVRGRADLVVVDGVPVGSPTEFQSLQLVRTGR